MKVLKTEINIKAKPEKIWTVLMDFESYPEWNPFIKSISGVKEVGAKLAVTMQPPESNPASFKPSILSFKPNKELRWKGKLIIRGVFDGEHYFILDDNGDGTTTFIQGENFSGFLVAFLGKLLEKTGKGFILMNEALKDRCE